MTKQNFSQPPWRIIDNGRLIIVDKDYKHIAVVYDNPDGKDAANARLMTLEPNMQNLLQEILDMAVFDEDRDVLDNKIETLLSMVRGEEADK